MSPATILHSTLKVNILILNLKYSFDYLGPVVQSVVSLTSLLGVISLTVSADSIHNILIYAKATHIFSAKKFSIFAYHSM